MYIKVFTDGAAVIISEERDRTCSNPQGHDFNPESGAPLGDNGNCCAHCGHFVGRHEEMRDAEEAQAYAQVMLGATGPVEVRPGAIAQAKLPMWADDIELGCTSYEEVE